MMKFFTLVAACSITVAANSQLFQDDFEGGSLTGNNAWTIQNVIGGGTYEWFYDNFSGDNFAEVDGYDGSADDDAESWLISPVMDLSGATQPVLKFATSANYGQGDPNPPALEIYISNTYGGGAINMGDWTEITGANLSTDGFNEVPSGDLDITSMVSGTATYIAFRYQSSALNGGLTYQLDDVIVQEGLTTVPDLAIYDVQYSVAGPSPEVGNIVSLTGVVTALSLAGGGSGEGYFIQDADGAWNGLMIEDATNTPSVGDSVEVTGTIEENFNFTRMTSVSAFNNAGTPTTYTPAATVITAAQASSMEDYESVFVMIQDAECTNDNSGFGLWQAHDGTDTIQVDDDCFDNSGVLGNWYDLSGIMSYSFSEFKINPRTGADLTVVGTASIVETSNEMIMYPNPAMDNVTVNAAPEAVVAIYSMTGALVANGVSNKTIDVSDLNAGIYQVVVTENGVQSTQKLVIK